jgi:hypothetical protein
MTIRGVFTPIEQDSMLLIDRGVIDNYPADLVLFLEYNTDHPCFNIIYESTLKCSKPKNLTL